MQSSRIVAHAPRTSTLATEISQLNSPCIGCEACQGICAALVDTMLLPDLLLRKRAT